LELQLQICFCAWIKLRDIEGSSMSSVPSASARDASSPSATLAGLTAQETEARLSKFGANDPTFTRRGAFAFELLRLFLNPLVIILLVASVISAFLGQHIEAELIFVIVIFNSTPARTRELDRNRIARRLVARNQSAGNSGG
jgi:magnesium-transporting ATPase (P-type)